ncbi:hypothetical protein J3R83DRAFT_11290, partial [Lanmaoa asiatica]
KCSYYNKLEVQPQPHTLFNTMFILQLPVELLTRIFIHCLPDEPYLEPNRAQAPLLLTRVCQSVERVGSPGDRALVFSQRHSRGRLGCRVRAN